jgi:hypothetical protein
MCTAPIAQYDIFTRHLPTHPSETHGDHFGDELLLPKPANTTRCEFRNINGISIDKQGLQFRHQHQHLHHNDLVTKSRNGALWLVNLLSRMWDHVFILWDLYKASLHGATEVAQNAILSRNLALRIQALHDRKLDVRADDCRWFIPNLAYYLSVAKPQSMRNWLFTYVHYATIRP